MEAITYVWENRIILIPALIIIGWFVKSSKILPDKFIPLILMGLGILLSLWMEMELSVNAVVQGILVAGTAVLGNQIPKQIRKKGK